MAEPDSEPGQPAGNAERDAYGRFLPGHVGLGGRPKGYDFHAILLERVKRRNETAEEATIRIIDNLLAATEVPSCAASAGKVLLDRICGPVIAVPIHSGEFDPSNEEFA